MKRSLILSLALAASMTGAVAQDLPETEINVVGNLGTTTQSKLLEAPFWSEKITELSGGKITTRFRVMNELGLRGSDLFNLASQNVMNVTSGALGHVSGQNPISDGNDLAGMSSNFDEFHKVTDAFFPVLQKYYRDNLGLHLMGMMSYQTQVFYCRVPLEGIESIAGKRIRVSGASQSDLIAHLGGSPVDMAFGEVQQALEQGVIDCAVTSTLGGYSNRWYEGTTHIYPLAVNFGALATVANADWWDSLDPAVQTFLTTEVDKLTAEMRVMSEREDAEGVACNTTGPCPIGEPAGLTLVEVTDEDLAKRREAFEAAVLPNWIKRCGEPCVEAFNTAIAPAAGLQPVSAQ